MGLTPEQIAKNYRLTWKQIKVHKGKSLPKKKCMFMNQNLSLQTIIITPCIQVINGKCPSKSNCYTIIKLKGISSLGKTKH